MADVFKYVFIATGRNDPPPPPETKKHDPQAFTKMAANKVRLDVARYNKLKGTPSSPLGDATVVRFVRWAFMVGNPTDAQQGSVTFYDHPFPADRTVQFPANSDPTTRKQWARDPQSIWQPVTDTNKFPKSAKISIVDVYHAVRAALAQSVLDVTFLSHGFIDGPVLANTSDDNRKQAPNVPQIRSGADRDGRSRTDFKSNMGEDPTLGGANALGQFQAALAPGAVIRIYGCDATEAVFVPNPIDPTKDDEKLLRDTAYQVTHAAYIQPRKIAGAKPATLAALKAKYPTQWPIMQISGGILRAKGKPMSMIVPMENEFKVEQEEAADLGTEEADPPTLKSLHYPTDPIFFVTQTFDLNENFTDVVEYCARRIMGGYLFAAADALPGVTCFGPVPGIGADVNQTGANPLMHVDEKTYGSRLQFYKTYLDIDSTEPGASPQRHYARFDTATVQEIRDHAVLG